MLLLLLLFFNSTLWVLFNVKIFKKEFFLKSCFKLTLTVICLRRFYFEICILSYFYTSWKLKWTLNLYDLIPLICQIDIFILKKSRNFFELEIWYRNWIFIAYAYWKGKKKTWQNTHVSRVSLTFSHISFL